MLFIKGESNMNNYFEQSDKKIGDFLDQLIMRTENNFLFWVPLSRYMSECENNIAKRREDPNYIDDYRLQPIGYRNIVEMVNSKSTIKFYEEDSFYVQKKNSMIFLIHIMQHSQFNNKDDDNYLLYGIPFSGFYTNISGLLKETEAEKNNAQKVKQLCDVIKQYNKKWSGLDEGNLIPFPMSFLVKNILSD